MKKNRHTTEQIIEKLFQADRALGKGQQVADICKQLGLPILRTRQLLDFFSSSCSRFAFVITPNY
jgi:hypothetical protein